jgi:hypothetical protein
MCQHEKRTAEHWLAFPKRHRSQPKNVTASTNGTVSGPWLDLPATRLTYLVYISIYTQSSSSFLTWQPCIGHSLPWISWQQDFYRVGLSTPRPTPNLGVPACDVPPYLWPQERGWPSYTPRHWLPILVAFYDMHGLQWDYSLIPVTTRRMYTQYRCQIGMNVI